MSRSPVLLGFGLSAGSRAHDQQVNHFDAGLRSSQGADVIISMIRSRRFVHRLIIGHNELGDEGCQRLFGFLCSNEGKKYDIQEISLNSNAIGDGGLVAVSQYLKDNKRVRELFLQNNGLKGTPHATTTFVEAVNSSTLEILSLTTNNCLSDTFLSQFLPSLNAPRLHELQISAIGLSSLSGKTIAAFLASPRCKLQVLKCNGNSLGLCGIKPIVRSMQTRNYSLMCIEMYANQLLDEEDVLGEDTGEVSEEENQVLPRDFCISWRACEARVKHILLRNTHLKREINKQSLILLRYSRPLLLQSKRRLGPTNDYIPLPLVPSTTTQVDINQNIHTRPFQFRCLPVELQHHILSFLAPSLSSSQRIRVLEYSTTTKTLPRLLPPLSSLSRRVPLRSGNGFPCIPDPSSIEFALGGTIWPAKADKNPFKPNPCVVDHRMGSSNSLLCNREKERNRFLEEVGCDVYELVHEDRPGSLRELYTLSLT